VGGVVFGFRLVSSRSMFLCIMVAVGWSMFVDRVVCGEFLSLWLFMRFGILDLVS